MSLKAINRTWTSCKSDVKNVVYSGSDIHTLGITEIPREPIISAIIERIFVVHDNEYFLHFA